MAGNRPRARDRGCRRRVAVLRKPARSAPAGNPGPGGEPLQSPRGCGLGATRRGHGQPTTSTSSENPAIQSGDGVMPPRVVPPRGCQCLDERWQALAETKPAGRENYQRMDVGGLVDRHPPHGRAGQGHLRRGQALGRGSPRRPRRGVQSCPRASTSWPSGWRHFRRGRARRRRRGLHGRCRLWSCPIAPRLASTGWCHLRRGRAPSATSGRARDPPAIGGVAERLIVS
jgi:hypothetical protein